MHDYYFPCTECGKLIDVNGPTNFHTFEENSWHDDFIFLCPFCADAQIKALQHVEYINWLEQITFADMQYKPLPQPTISYIWRETDLRLG